MPVDVSQPLHSRRISSRKANNEEDIDLRRARGEISCAECRRLKLKCDKQLPCGSCVRRGCPSICPNGSLSTGQGTRFVLADTAQLHAKITEMGQRIRQLEDALSVLQSAVSNEHHPLLHESLLSIKFGPERSLSTNDPSAPTELIDALGTLTIGKSGEVRYFGRSAGSETLFMAGAELEAQDDVDDDESLTQHQLPSEIVELSNTFPFKTERGLAWAMNALLQHLPPQPRAWTLCETYIEHGTWSFKPLKRDEIINDILTPTYKFLKDWRVSGSTIPYAISPHQLAVLFMIFALGTFVDLTLDSYDVEAETYHRLSRAALSLRSVFDSPEVATLQAVVLMAAYHGLGSKAYTFDGGWTLLSLGMKLAQSLGLRELHHLRNQNGVEVALIDRDSARWQFDPITVQRRRALFWELISAEQFYSLALGRPPSIILSYIDCEFPEDDEATLDDQGNVLVGFYRWKYEFVKDIFCSITELSVTAEPPSYQTVLELDRKLRAKALPPHLNAFLSPEDTNCSLSVYMRGCLLEQLRTVSLLYLHRSFFVQAMLDYPNNPLRSPYSPSFLAAYRCASGVIKRNLNNFDRFPELCSRWWSIWTHLFSAAIIVGSIVARAPSSSMAASAFIELGLAYDLFKKGAVKSRRAKFGLAILDRLQERALQVYSQFRSGRPISNLLSIDKPHTCDDELALFGGQTRVMVTNLLSSSTCRRGRPPTSSCAEPSPGSEGSGESRTTPTSGANEVHPSLLEYLSCFPPSTSPRPVLIAPSFPFAQPEAYPTTPIGFAESNQMWQQPPHLTATSDFASHAGEGNSMNEGTCSRTIPPPVQDSSHQLEDSLSSNLQELGMMMSGDTGMDGQWLQFMRQIGLIGDVSQQNIVVSQ